MFFVRKIYCYSKDGENPLAVFAGNFNEKIKRKLRFVLRYAADEKNPLREPHVKHFTIEKYKRLYELRMKASNTMIRIIYFHIGDDIVLLHAFVKRDKRDTEQALEFSLKMIEKIDKHISETNDFLTEVTL